MPLYMDRHDVSASVTAENVAELHQQDLKIQHKFNCRGLTYWFDGDRNTAFCLIEAPDKESIQKMHNRAHGEVPNEIIEVDPQLVESFLGRMEDPVSSENNALNIINEPAFRTIMQGNLRILSLEKQTPKALASFFNKYINAVAKLFKRFEAGTVKQGEQSFLLSFKSVSNAVNFAKEAQALFSEFSRGEHISDIGLILGMCTGSPVTEKKTLFESSIKLVNYLCTIEKSEIISTTEVKNLYERENINASFDNKTILVLNPSEEALLIELMEFIEKNWTNPDLKVEDFNKNLGMSKSNTYRKLTELTGKSPNEFLREYRLNHALASINTKKNTISEIAYNTGFNSPSYFSKCFQKRFGLLPSHYQSALTSATV
ncbi:MAG: nickel-binding protein [Chitinophagales bacterium]